MTLTLCIWWISTDKAPPTSTTTLVAAQVHVCGFRRFGIKQVRLNQRCNWQATFFGVAIRHGMVNEIAYDIYRGTNDRTLRLATLPGAGLPAHLKTQRLDA